MNRRQPRNGRSVVLCVRYSLEDSEAGCVIGLVEQHLDDIRQLCEEFGVLRLELFGSAATGRFDAERSDLDFLVEYPDDYDYGPWLARHFELQERLEELFERRVDLVMAGASRNPYFIRSLNASRQLLYAA